MNVSVYDITVPQFVRELTALKAILHKAGEFAEKKKIQPEVLLQTRLAPDQFPLSRQIQITSDGAKACAARLTGIEAPVFEDKEQKLEEFMVRLDKTITFLKTVKAESFAGYEKRTARFPWNPGYFMDGHTYLVQHALPNFYFHLTTAYSILRASGLELGKADYLGKQDWQKDA